MKGIRPLLCASLTGTAALMAASGVSANDPPPAGIFDLAQEDQDVIVTVGIHAPWGYPDIDEEFDLVRTGTEGETTVLSGEVFDIEDGVVEEWDCRTGDDQPPDCEETPEECEDCDGDGDIDCPVGDCAAYYLFEVADVCVPPGSTVYSLENEDEYGLWSDEEGIEVADSGVECSAGDDEDNGDEGAGSPGAGCSASGLGGSRRAAPVGTALLMLLAGIVALRARKSTGA